MFKDIYYFHKIKFLLAIIVTAGCFLFTYLYYDFYYVEYEALFDSFYSGRLTEGLPFRSVYFLGNIGTSHIYSLLYQFYPKVEWISWILYFYLFVSCLIGLYLILEILPESLSLFLKVVILVVVYFLVFADHNIHFIFTRVSYMATGLSLIGLVYFFHTPGSIRDRLWLFLFFNVWFVIGTLTRSESATAALLQVAFFALFYIQSIKRIVVLFLFPIIFLLSLLSAIAWDINTTRDFYKQIEPDIEAQYTDRDNTVPLSAMRTERDSVMWSAAKDIMWADPRVMSPSYLRSLILPEKFLFTDARQWRRALRVVSDISRRFWYVCILVVLMDIGLLIRYRFSSAIRFLLWLAFISSFWLLSGMQTYTDKINDRSFSPLISLFLLCHIILLLPYLTENVWRRMYPVLAGIILLFGIHLFHLKAEANQLQRDLGDYQKNLAIITKVAAHKILVVNSSSCDYLFSSNRPFHPFDFSSFRKIYITDGYNIPFLPYYRRYLEGDCHCNMYDFPSFWEYLRTRHNDVVIISTTPRMTVLKQYMMVIHGYDLPTSESKSTELLQLQESDHRGIFANLKIYDLGK